MYGVGRTARNAKLPSSRVRKHAAQVVLLGLGVLHRVELVVAVLPDVELGAGDRVARGVEHAPVDPGRRAGARLLGDALAVLAGRRARDIERAEHGGLGGAFRQRVGQRVDEHREPHRVRPEDELLPPVVGYVASARQDSNSVHPLVLGQPDLAGEAVQVTGEGLHDLAQARVCAVVEARDDPGRDVLRRGPSLAHFGKVSLHERSGQDLPSVGQIPIMDAVMPE